MSRVTRPEVTWWWGPGHASLAGPEHLVTAVAAQYRLGVTTLGRDGVVELAWEHGTYTPTPGGLKAAVARAGGVLA